MQRDTDHQPILRHTPNETDVVISTENIVRNFLALRDHVKRTFQIAAANDRNNEGYEVTECVIFLIIMEKSINFHDKTSFLHAATNEL